MWSNTVSSWPWSKAGEVMPLCKLSPVGKAELLSSVPCPGCPAGIGKIQITECDCSLCSVPCPAPGLFLCHSLLIFCTAFLLFHSLCPGLLPVNTDTSKISHVSPHWFPTCLVFLLFAFWTDSLCICPSLGLLFSSAFPSWAGSFLLWYFQTIPALSIPPAHPFIFSSFLTPLHWFQPSPAIFKRHPVSSLPLHVAYTLKHSKFSPLHRG